MLIIIDPPRNAIEIIFGKSNDYSYAMRLPKYFLSVVGFHIGFDEAYRLIGICLPRHQIRLSFLEELDRLEGQGASLNDNKVEAKLKNDIKVTKEDGTLTIRFTNQSDGAFALTNTSSKFPVFAIMTEYKASVFEFDNNKLPMLNGFVIPLGILPNVWLDEIEIISGADCLKDPNSDLIGNPPLPEQICKEFFSFSYSSPKPLFSLTVEQWAQELGFRSYLSDFNERPPSSRAFQKPRPPLLVVSPRIEVLAKALDGSGVETEIYIFQKGEKFPVDKGVTNASVGGWWRSRTLQPSKYEVMTILQLREKTYFESYVVDLIDKDVSIESGPVWRRIDAAQKFLTVMYKTHKGREQEIEAQELNEGKVIRVLTVN
jgi:hypothetical protein